MRLLFVVQRYGAEVAGGAEQHCRQFARRLSAMGHRVEVVTSRAINSATWEDEYRPGADDCDGVTVHRLSTGMCRDEAYFDALSWRVLYSGEEVAPVLAEAWVRAQGPLLPELVPWLSQRVSGFDVVVFFTYLFFPTWAGLPAAVGRAPTVLHGTAHDEPPFWLPVYDVMLRLPDVYAWSTEEERDLLRRRGAGRIPGEVIGIGTDLDAAASGDPVRFRRTQGLQDRPYLLTLGRVAEGKGSPDLAAWFAAYKERRPGPLALVFAGEIQTELERHPDIFTTGFVTDRDRNDALAGAFALVQPSYFESFSMVLSEAWAAGKPSLVQGRSAVLAGQAHRSGGALCFTGFAEFGAAVDLLLDDPGLTARLGAAGRAYVAERYSWEAVLERYVRLLELSRSTYRRRATG
jgi:glycosyltransferase involved in cell wall biosynthesis